jgi:7-cyano-7-deazaguanine synthase in queuosine biosynthesis
VIEFEVLPSGARQRGNGEGLWWPVTSGDTADVKTDLLWHLSPYQSATPEARDLFRVIAAAFLADVRSVKPLVRLHREISLVVHVSRPTGIATSIESLVDLLGWLTGDSWTIELVEASPVSMQSVQTEALHADRVQLLSGGLDSLCGAIVSLRDSRKQTVFVGHMDSSTAVRHAQGRVLDALAKHATYRRHELTMDAGMRSNHGPRTRSLLFFSLALLVASAAGAREIVVPENGFTSINPPLDPSRSGPLTTRSTHPYTFYLFERVRRQVGLGDVHVTNPHSTLTKGQLVRLAMPELLAPAWMDATGSTLSCAKGDTQYFGGDPNRNCGLCIACLVRRASFLAARVADPTPYEVDMLTGTNRQALIERRRKDLAAAAEAASVGISDDSVLASGMWPPGTDFNLMFDLCRRGLKEIARVPLP